MERIFDFKRAMLLFLVIMLLMPAALLADEKTQDKGLEYTIQKGDTLWTISSGKLKDPFLWPKLWEANPQVHNPHLIYPDQHILIPNELLKDSLRTDVVLAPRDKFDSKTKKRYIPVKTIAARSIPSGDIKPIVSREVLLDSGYFSKNFVSSGNVRTNDSERAFFGKGDSVYISSAEKLIPDTKYYIGAKPEKIVDPSNKNIPSGFLVRIKGVLQISGKENGKITGIIIENYKEIFEGDVIFTYYPVSLPYAPTLERKPPVTGTILVVDNNRLPGGKGDVVYINRGAGNSIVIGDIFTISSAQKPNPVLGTFQVFSVFDDAAIAVVTKSTSAIKPGDTFGN
jgi:LysM repeat protein